MTQVINATLQRMTHVFRIVMHKGKEVHRDYPFSVRLTYVLANLGCGGVRKRVNQESYHE